MSEPFIGEIQLFGFNFAPRQWAYCNGALMTISQNTALFSLLGTAYGGDGRNTFALPDLTGRAACGDGHGPGLTPRERGQRFGEDAVTLTEAQIAAHMHGLNVYNETDPDKRAGTPAAGYGLTRPSAPSFATSGASQPFANKLDPTGGAQPHENRQPYLAVNFCIALEGVFPPRP